jgi:hypothetical protein
MTEPAETGSADREGREEQIREYIHRALFATDIESPTELVRAREVVLGRTLPKTLMQSRDSEEYLQRREANKAKIEECRTRFWELTHEQLQGMLDIDSLHQDADLLFSAERLIHVSTLRGDFSELTNRLGHKDRIARVLKSLIMLAPREAAGFREAELRTMRTGQTKKEMKLGAKRIREEFPKIFALESSWLTEVEAFQRQSNRVRTYQQAEAASNNWVVWVWLSIVFGGVFIRFIGRIMRGE